MPGRIGRTDEGLPAKDERLCVQVCYAEVSDAPLLKLQQVGRARQPFLYGKFTGIYDRATCFSEGQCLRCSFGKIGDRNFSRKPAFSGNPSQTWPDLDADEFGAHAMPH